MIPVVVRAPLLPLRYSSAVAHSHAVYACAFGCVCCVAFAHTPGLRFAGCYGPRSPPHVLPALRSPDSTLVWMRFYSACAFRTALRAVFFLFGSLPRARVLAIAVTSYASYRYARRDRCRLSPFICCPSLHCLSPLPFVHTPLLYVGLTLLPDYGPVSLAHKPPDEQRWLPPHARNTAWSFLLRVYAGLVVWFAHTVCTRSHVLTYQFTFV